jgi:hypothetical protein
MAEETQRSMSSQAPYNDDSRAGQDDDRSVQASSSPASAGSGTTSNRKLEVGKTQYYPGHSFSHATDTSRKKRAPPLTSETVEQSK